MRDVKEIVGNTNLEAALKFYLNYEGCKGNGIA